MRRLAVIGSSVVLMSGCGNADHATPTAGNTAPPPAAGVQPANTASDPTTARSALLRAQDLPGGWTATGHASRSSDTCLAAVQARAAVTGRAVSTDFASTTDHSKFQHAIYLYATPAQAAVRLRELSTKDTRACEARSLADTYAKAAKAQGATIGKITTAELKIAPPGTQTTAVRFTTPLTAGATHDKTTLDQIVTRTGRGLSLLTIIDATDQTSQRIPAAAASRLQTALKNGG